TPGDPFDYDGVNELVQADLTINGGAPRKGVMQANRTGFLYVPERAPAKPLAANKFVKVTWADSVDLETGRPVWSADTKAAIEGKKVTVWPAAPGGKNWGPMSFSPQTGLLYVNALEIGWEYEAEPLAQGANLKAGQPFYGVKRKFVFDNPEERGYLRAIDPATGKAKWQVPPRAPRRGGPRVRGPADRRVRGLRCRERQAALEVPDAVRRHRAAHHLGEGRQAI